MGKLGEVELLNMFLNDFLRKIRYFSRSPGFSIFLNITPISLDLPLINAHALKLEATGGNFFQVDLKISVEIELNLIQKFSLMVNSADAQNAVICSLTQQLLDAENNLKKRRSQNFLIKNSQNFHIFSLNPSYLTSPYS